MRTIAVMAMLLAGMALALGCADKKKGDSLEEIEETVKPLRKTCPVAMIKLTPSRVDDPAITVRSGRSVEFAATPVDASGAIMAVPLSWRLRYPDSDVTLSSGQGHVLEVMDNGRAVFTANGIAPGVFTVLVEDRSCNLADGDTSQQYPDGQALVRVYEDPAAEVSCGRMRVTYGDEIDRVGEEVIASNKVLLIAEVSSREKLGRKYKAQFYLNEKPYPGLRPIYKQPRTRLAAGMAVGEVSYLPLYLVPGEFKVRYELLHDGRIVCGSRTERFRAR